MVAAAASITEASWWVGAAVAGRPMLIGSVRLAKKPASMAEEPPIGGKEECSLRERGGPEKFTRGMCHGGYLYPFSLFLSSRRRNRRSMASLREMASAAVVLLAGIGQPDARNSARRSARHNLASASANSRLLVRDIINSPPSSVEERITVNMSSGSCSSSIEPETFETGTVDDGASVAVTILSFEWRRTRERLNIWPVVFKVREAEQRDELRSILDDTHWHLSRPLWWCSRRRFSWLAVVVSCLS